MGFIVGRSTPAPELETKKTARYGEQKVVATETPVANEEVTVLDAPAAEEEVVVANDADAGMENPHEGQNFVGAPAAEEENVEKPAQAKRGRKPKKA